MMRFMRFKNGRATAIHPAGRAAVLMLASVSAGCSASVGSDFSSFGFSDSQQVTSSSSSSSSRRNPNYLGNDGYGSGGYSAPRSYGDDRVASQNLPDATPSSTAYSGGRQGTNYAAADTRYDGANSYGRSSASTNTNTYGRSPDKPASNYNSYTDSGRYGTVAPSSTASTNRYDPQPTPSMASPGDTIDVQPGDTLYGLSRRYNVSVAELMQINSLTNTNLQVGQRLYLPQGTSGGMASAGTRYAPQPSVPPTQTASIQPPPPPPVADADSRYNGVYTMRPGDSLYAVSRMYGVPVGELQRANGITDARGIKAGTVLRVPTSGGMATANSNGAPMQHVAVTPPPQTAQYTPAAGGNSTQPTMLNGSGGSQSTSLGQGSQYTQVATRNTNDVAAGKPAVASGSDKLRWPVHGRIITGFGQRADGTHNDGINLSVPLGTSVHAAESGTVAYAGAELKGYGNLILLRHDNGWVTAYAHNDQLMVKRGDKVQRGQVIATAGRTGSVDQPQVHFELRQGSKPVDPVPFLERVASR